ncbi:MAG: succinate dehydrogenase/fumarate reductase iron-sulfur subunit [Epsilonproteobacteria bacterium]|nr:succinate dehydrogenase/fumarate reductase iron-sulfur subunit [Campylobacterota bacterium]MBD3838941.1 succinate dehydrogenase/fumarate reductase iron-sulfur subunit [Campylobacterota bacterium]
MSTKKVTIKAFRFNAETDYLPYYKNYEMEVGEDELILDLLNRVKWEHDGSFSYRRSCRHGICGACGIKVNGKAVLACKQNALALVELFGDELVFEPQSKKRAVKDMIIDKGDFWKKHADILPFVESHVDAHPTSESKMSPAQLFNVLDADYCIQCGACHYSCPVIEINEDFFGPAAFAAAYRFSVDPRDNSSELRLEMTAKMGQGVWDCVKCFECVEACPKEVNPLEKITKLHNMQFEQKIAQRNVATKHAEGFVRSIKKHGLLDEADIVKYSEGQIGVLKHMGDAIKMMKAGKIHLVDQIPFVDNMPKSKNLDEIKKLIAISQTNKL